MFLLINSFPDLSSPEMWFSLLTLTFLEIVLGVDNIIFITIASNRLPKEKRPFAMNVGLALAMVLRIALLFGISYLIAMQEPFFSIEGDFLSAGFSGQSLILIAGGIFLLYKSVTEIHHKLEGDNELGHKSVKGSSLVRVIIQITLINIVFSFDSILTAVGLTEFLWIMILSVVFSIVIMIVFANPVSKFVNEHPTIQMLGLSFLILIGFMLIAEGAHLAHVEMAGSSIGAVPKGYLYFAIVFSLFVEFLNLRLRRRVKPVQLHGIGETAVKEGIIHREESSQ